MKQDSPQTESLATFSATVIKGQQRGRLFGFPTANFLPPSELTLENGVYLVKLTGFSKHTGQLPGVANLGVRPTVDGTKRLFEVHLFDFSEDIYGETLHIIATHHLRPEKKFATIEDLKAQIIKDVQRAKQLINFSDGLSD